MLWCHHSTMYVQQYLISRLQLFEEFVTTALQFHNTKDNRSVRSDIQVLLFFPCMTTPWLICCCEEVILSVVDHWWWPFIPPGPIICTCRSCLFSLSFRNLLWCCNVNRKISMPFFHYIGVWLKKGCCKNVSEVLTLFFFGQFPVSKDIA